MYSISSPTSSVRTEAVTSGMPSSRTMACATELSGIRTPTVRRPTITLSEIRDEAGRIKVNGPGRLCFRSLKTRLSTLAYSATSPISEQTIESSIESFPPRIVRSRSIAFG